MKKVLLTTIALTAIGVGVRARVKNIESEITKLEVKVSEINGKINR